MTRSRTRKILLGLVIGAGLGAALALAVALGLVGSGRLRPSDASVHAAVQVLLSKQWEDIGPTDPRQRAAMTPDQKATVAGIRSTIHMTEWQSGTSTRLADGSWAVAVAYSIEYASGPSLMHFDSTATAIVGNDGMFSWSAIRLDNIRPVGGPVTGRAPRQ
jgi:hypothetical protein